MWAVFGLKVSDAYMDILFFQNATTKEMSRIKKKYSLVEIIEGEVVKYQGNKSTLIIALDHFAEISVCVRSNTESYKMIYLESFMKYVGFSAEEIATVNRNQHSEGSLERFLQKVSPIIDKMISKIMVNHNIFDDCFRFTTMRDAILYDNKVLQETKKDLNAKWESCEYLEFLELYKKHKACLSNDRLLKQKVLYATKKISNTD